MDRSFVILYDHYTDIKSLTLTLIRFPEKPSGVGSIIFTDKELHDRIVDIAVQKAITDLAKLVGSMNQRRRRQPEQEEDDSRTNEV